MYNTKNYTEQGGEITHIGGKLVFDEGAEMEGAIAPAVNLTSSATMGQLVTALKNAGLMIGDSFALVYDAVDNDNESVRAGNTAHISSVTINETAKLITIVLDCKVSDLADFDARNGWGVHKWLGIGLKETTISDITDLTYNGSAITAEDVTEATNVGLGSGYFVRWVAADLVLAGDDTHKSKGSFTLGASGFARTRYTLVIVETEE